MKDRAYCLTPIGLLELSGNGQAVTSIRFTAEEEPGEVPDYLRRAAEQVRAYFDGSRHALDFPIEPQGTAFQKQVWQALRQIPYGQTATYGQIALALGKRKAARAVGAAAGKNPCLLAVPCHRLVGQKGLVGFAAGLERKAFLLRLEGVGVFPDSGGK